MKEFELEPEYYPLEMFSRKTNISVEELLLYAEQDNLKLSIKVDGKSIVFCSDDALEMDCDTYEIDVNNLSSDVIYAPEYKGYLQLSQFTIQHLKRRLSKTKAFKEDLFVSEDKKNCNAIYLNGKGYSIHVRNIIVTRKYYKQFIRLIDNPTTKAKEVYYQNKPSTKTTALYNEVFDLYVANKVKGLSTSPAVIVTLIKERQDKIDCIISMSEDAVTWQSPTNAKNIDTKVGSVENRISEWNSHYKKLNL